RIITPLQELTSSMHQLINNQLDFEIGKYTMIELSEMAYALKIFRDNSIALAARQDDLQNNNQLLSRVNHDLHAFIHVASHDLKSPLHGIRVLSDFVIDDLKQNNSADAQNHLALLKRRIIRMERLIESLLSYTRSDAKSVETSPVNVDTLIGEIFDLVNVDGKFRLKLTDEIPVCQVVESDLNIIFMNLLDNSIRHHDKDSGIIDIRFNQNEHEYIFEVVDDGPGIDSKYHGLIFEVLQTLKSKDDVEGSGVGLAHAKRVIESRGGSIHVISDPQVKRGARFLIRYPKVVLAP
ncbi:MAG: HAMP domain-containing sensor histidine kinase, partial [Pseudomonadota bacterium]